MAFVEDTCRAMLLTDTLSLSSLVSVAVMAKQIPTTMKKTATFVTIWWKCYKHDTRLPTQSI